MNVDPVNVSTEEDDKQVTEERNLDARRTRNILREYFVTISITSLPRENKRGQTKTTPYGSRQLNQAMYSEPKQADIPKNTNESSQVSNHRNIPQKIDLGWSDPFSVR